MTQRDREEQPEAPDLGAAVRGPEDEPADAGRGGRTTSAGGGVAPADPVLDAAAGDDPVAERAERDEPDDGGEFEPRRSWGPVDAAAGIDSAPDAGGAAAPASGRQDVGPDVWP